MRQMTKVFRLYVPSLISQIDDLIDEHSVVKILVKIENKKDFNAIECREVIHQNYATLNNLMECNESDYQIKNLNGSIETYDFSKRKLVKGQWIDVKDTINQWLEAQVIDVKEDKVYIHYNGWGTRWDEWIEMGSNRIRPFRYYTQQTRIYNYHSPYPNYKPDADVNMQSNNSSDFFDLFDGMSTIHI